MCISQCNLDYTPDLLCHRRVARLAAGVERGLGVHEKGNNETVKTQDFGENENQDHADEETGLLGSSADTSITDNANGETSGHTGQTDGETGTELDEASVEGKALSETVGDQDRDDQTVNTDDTSHNDGNNVWKGARQR